LAIVILIAGCPYSSSVPIDEGTVKVHSDLPGEWISESDKESDQPVENPTYYVITTDDKFHATAKKMEYSSSDSSYSETIYHLTFSDVKGTVFMNALEEGGDTYSLYRFSFDEKTGKITTEEVTDYIKETFNSSKELKDFISKNMSNSYFFTNTGDTFVRK
jgi:peptide methionine sulfoxide reductase MsrA